MRLLPSIITVYSFIFPFICFFQGFDSEYHDGGHLGHNISPRWLDGAADPLARYSDKC